MHAQVWQHGQMWQDPASTSLRAPENKTCASFTEQQRPCQKHCSCHNLPSVFLPLPLVEQTGLLVSMAVQDQEELSSSLQRVWLK